MSKSKIEWLARPGTVPESWNFVGGCTEISSGCRNCYAKTMSWRIQNMPKHPPRYDGVVGKVELPSGASELYWRTHNVKVDEEAILAPLHWRKPRTVFVCSMSDLFHMKVPWDVINRAFGVMALTPQHTYVILTKRADRMQAFFEQYEEMWYWRDRIYHAHGPGEGIRLEGGGVEVQSHPSNPAFTNEVPLEYWPEVTLPLPNVWLGVTVEQTCYTWRLEKLKACPAAVRFVSMEPLLERIRVDKIGIVNYLTQEHSTGLVDWVIVGGESGNRSKVRPCPVEDIADVVDRCRKAGIPVFVKQLGSYPTLRWMKNASMWDSDDTRWTFDVIDGEQILKRIALEDPKGADPSEWPIRLRVREWPR